MNQLIKRLSAAREHLSNLDGDLPEDLETDYEEATTLLDEVLFNLLQIRELAGKNPTTRQDKILWDTIKEAMNNRNERIATVCDEAAKVITLQREMIAEMKGSDLSANLAVQ